MSAEALEYDPYSYELDVDPYPVYRRMQDEAPAYYDERLVPWFPRGESTYFITSYTVEEE